MTRAPAIIRVVRVYLDMCVLKRPYDKPSDRTTLESLAVAQVVSAFERGRVELISSAACEYFVSCDDQLLASARRAAGRLAVRVLDLLSMASILESEDRP